MCVKSNPVLLVSDVDLILSKVNVLLSEVAEKLSRCTVESTKLLPRVGNILSEMQWIVKLAQNTADSNDEDCCEDDGDVSLVWDDYNYTSNYYNLFHHDETQEVDVVDDREEVGDDREDVGDDHEAVGDKRAVVGDEREDVREEG